MISDRQMTSLLLQSFAQAVVIVHEYVRTDEELDDAMANRVVHESFPILSRLNTPSLQKWMMDDLAHAGICAGAEREGTCKLLSDAFDEMVHKSMVSRYTGAQFVLELITTQYEARGYFLDQ